MKREIPIGTGAWIRRMAITRVVAVVTLDDVELAEPVAAALLEGGVDLMELTLRTPVALDCLRRIRKTVPGMGVGAGTLLTPDQVQQAHEAGAEFGVAPGLNPKVVETARLTGLPFAPGVCTPSDIERAIELGSTLLKFFPAATQGGTAHFRTVIAPYLHLGLQFIPLGGITQATAASFLQEPGVLALGGSWIAPRDRIERRDWSGIREAARAVRQVATELPDPSPR